MIGFAVDEGMTLDSFAPIVVKCLFKQFAISIGLVTNTLSNGFVRKLSICPKTFSLFSVPACYFVLTVQSMIVEEVQVHSLKTFKTR